MHRDSKMQSNVELIRYSWELIKLRHFYLEGKAGGENSKSEEDGTAKSERHSFVMASRSLVHAILVIQEQSGSICRLFY